MEQATDGISESLVEELELRCVYSVNMSVKLKTGGPYICIGCELLFMIYGST